jgi:hypothetical protein
MAIFPHLLLESIIQVNDKTRLDARKSYIVNETEPISKVEISPDNGVTYIDVTGNLGAREPTWYADYQFATDGTVTIRCRVTVGSLIPVTSEITRTLEVISTEDDHLFSTDTDLLAIEPDIMKYLPDGRSSWIREHRKAQTLIISWLNKNNVRDVSGNPITKSNVIDTTELREWSLFLTLSLVFKALSNSTDDVYSKKASEFASSAVDARYVYSLRLDLNNNGVIDSGEGIMLRSIQMVRR